MQVEAREILHRRHRTLELLQSKASEKQLPNTGEPEVQSRVDAIVEAHVQILEGTIL